MIAYIGDISSADAEVLQGAAETHKRILEFGCGASTQILAKYKTGSLISIDTSLEWIDKTMENLALLNISASDINIRFHMYDAFMGNLRGYTGDTLMFDFIFDDGVDALRRQFAFDIWPHLSSGGILAMHDTRRAPDFRNVLEILARFQDEIGTVSFNVNDSNITLIRKTDPKPYDNWQITEKREPWMLGYGEIPESYKEIMKNSE